MLSAFGAGCTRMKSEMSDLSHYIPVRQLQHIGAEHPKSSAFGRRGAHHRDSSRSVAELASEVIR
jgi:hypothetical protein